MESFKFVLGVDVSKLTLDVSCAEYRMHIKIENSSKGFSDLKKWSKANKIDLQQTFVVMEFTGGYEYRFIQFCESMSIAYCRISGLEIKRSMGMTRGKSDKVDSFRIGQYGEEKIKKLQKSKPIDSNVLQLKQLLSFRKRLVREVAGLSATVKERKHIYELNQQDPIIRIASEKMKTNQAYIKQIEEQITTLIAANSTMLFNYKILRSIKGIGPINAWMTIAYTENFVSFTDARKYAVFVGVVPFEHTSGTSVNGKKRISQMANKELKQELNQAAKAAITHDAEMRSYAERKLKNKHYKIILNNVKFKLILRMFSLVKRGELYVENYKKAA